jgi:CDP-diacylglycerol--glycerol-3-phosphate 3-phosphatidyltransferase
MLEKNLASIFNLPNLITMARILLVPVLLLLVVTEPFDSQIRWISVAVFILIMASDGIDGAIARRKGLITNLGKLLDPIADKALLSGTLIALSILGEFPWWATILILVRELGITLYRLVVIKKRVVAASPGGKLKTILQGVLVGLVISPLPQLIGSWVEGFEFALTLLTVAVTVITGLQYLAAALRRDIS